MADEKIKANEVLDEKELEKVAGGFADEVYEDVGFIESKCTVTLTGGGSYDNMVSLLAENYASAGIRFQSHEDSPNEYYNLYTGEKVSRNTALNAIIDFARRNGRLRR